MREFSATKRMRPSPPRGMMRSTSSSCFRVEGRPPLDAWDDLPRPRAPGVGPRGVLHHPGQDEVGVQGFFAP